MSVFGSLFTGVSALNAQSQSLTVISNNIANNQTPGFKRSVTTFANLVTGSNTNSILQPGGVRAGTLGTVNQQGLLQQSGREEDLGILGDGFFVVGQNENNQIQFPFYTRAGRFEENEDGFLQTPQEVGGQVLYGWRLDDDGNIPTNFDNLDSLEPINLNFLPGFNQTTTVIDPAINFDASTGLSTNNGPTAAGFDSDFSRVITVFDSLGTPQTLNLEISKAPAPNLTNAVLDGTDLTLDTELNQSGIPLAVAETLTIDVGGAPVVVTIPLGTTSLTVGELIAQINAALPNAGVGAGGASLSDDGSLVITAFTEGEAVTVGGIVSSAGSSIFDQLDSELAGGGNIATAGKYNAALVVPYDPASPALVPATNPGSAVFPPLGTPASQDANPFGWWEVRISGGDQTNDNANIGYINFNPDGSINHDANANGNVAITLANIDFGNGSDPQTIDFTLDRLTQLNSQFLTTDIDQNGASFGIRRSFNIDTEGVVNVVFSNDEIVPLYKIALADFPAVNGLQSESLNVFSSSNESGEVSLTEANLNGSGQIFSGSFEQSNVDLANEFSQLIITQRAYSAGTKVITTADQMLAELLNIR
ncbi:MAG: flagellar hook-basal body complex protein [Alphaproteobacteria bacterium]|nr:flagellar hook-basal body complex protein [Alphaproteobacteria bacterium SS10]MBV6634233.1 flagellar hook-basal body complex protein [Alphaproteobacteria bacterium SS10]